MTLLQEKKWKCEQLLVQCLCISEISSADKTAAVREIPAFYLVRDVVSYMLLLGSSRELWGEEGLRDESRVTSLLSFCFFPRAIR